jgi:hypothetical protein
MLAFGFTMLLAGLVTTFMISIFGFVFIVAGCVGWFHDVLPHEQHEEVPILEQPVVITTSRAVVERVKLTGEHRPHAAGGTSAVMAGIQGGIAGGIAMAIPAMLYGLITHHSVWYAINLLGGAGVGDWAHVTAAAIATFHWQWLLIACVIHGIMCLLVGLLFVAMLPMLPRYPVVLCGLVAPILWSGIIHSFLGFVNPELSAHISWPWFVVSQIAFGVVAGLIISRQTHIHTSKHLPLAARMGFVIPGMTHHDSDAGTPHGEKETH